MTDSHTNGFRNHHALPPEARASAPREPLAVVGIGCRFPGADGPDAFWRLLEQGTDAVTEVPPGRWDADAFYDPDPGKPGKTVSRWGGFLPDIERFDPHFFGISPREAARMDPQQRLLLEVACEALEDAGMPLAHAAGGRAAVFVGISTWDYATAQTCFADRGRVDVHTNTGGSLSIAANRVSYCLDLRGPSAAVDTACSSALVAVHLACRSVWEGGCDMALAGGVNVILLPDWFVGFSRMGMLSPGGRCKAFDASADGFVRGEGAGLVLLKPLSKALADGDRVYALIRGTAVNQDGRTPGMTVPAQAAQEELLRLACADAGVSPSQVQYVEAHGTGTPVGDPIEARALGAVLGAGRPAGRPCLVGSVKTNVGHLEAGSGIAGLVKAALSLYHRRVPANLHLSRPNPAIDFDGLRLRVPTSLESWPEGEGPALAGVNSFGYGGTNAHVVLEGPRDDKGTRGQGDKGTGSPCHLVTLSPCHLVPVSARSAEALSAAAADLGRFAAEAPAEVSLADIASAAALRRSHHEHRLAVVAHSREELAQRLAAFAAGEPAPGVASGRAAAGGPPRLAFVCSGQGPQWWAMGRQLLEQEPAFRAVIERCDAAVRRLGPWSLLEELTAEEGRSRMAVTAVSQPCIFALQAGLAALWASWGVAPEAVVGHSVGEVAAAYLAGVFTLEEAVRVIYQRGRCMELAPSRGRMLAAALTADEARSARYGGRVSLAAVNAPSSITLSGEAADLEEIAGLLQGRQVFCKSLQVQYAFHSAQMDPVRDELLASLRGLRPRRATLPLFSTVTGRRLEGPEMGPDYWWHNVRRTVRFADGAGRLAEAGCGAVLELGPHPVLAAAVAECFGVRGRKVTVLPSLRRKEDERATLLASLGVLHALGHPVKWEGMAPAARRFVRLPGYPWQRERCWSESEESLATRLAGPCHPLLGRPLNGPRPSWESRLEARLLPYLADHRVQGAALVPATAYLEMAFAAARAAWGADACRLQEVKLSGPCFVPREGALRLRSGHDPSGGTLEVHSRPADGGDWSAHFSALLRPLAADEAAPLDPESVKPRCPRAYDRAGCYEYFRGKGLDYGPAFQGIERGWQGGSESLALVCLPEGLADRAGDYQFHPALLDACLQAVLPTGRDVEDAADDLYLPAEIEEVRLYRRAGPRLYSHARLRERTARQSVADVAVYDASDGGLVAQVRGLLSRRMAGGGEALEGLLYAYRWQPRPRPEAVPAFPGGWLVFADAGGVGERLAERLREAGGTCVLVRPGRGFARRGAEDYEVDAGSADDMAHVLAEALGQGRPPCRGVVHLWNLDAPPAEELATADLEAAQGPGLLSVVRLVQAWDSAADGDGLAPRLFLVTRGAQPAGDGRAPLALAQSPVVGLGRVVAGEYPRLRCRLVDLDPTGADADLDLALWGEAWAEDDEDEVALRGGVRLVRRFLPGVAEESDAEAGAPCRLGVTRPGTLDGLAWRRLRRRPPGPGEVEIEVVAAGLNFSDVLKALGLYPGLPDGPPPLGAECSGRITAVGAGVEGLREGDEVLAVAPCAFASQVLARAELVAPKPPQVSFEEAAALPIAYLTAHYGLEHLARLSAGERVLVHSASGGVGLAALALARRAGAEVLATAGTEEKRDLLRGLGVAHVFDSRSLSFADGVLAATGGRGVDVVLNSLAGEALAAGLSCLADYGRFVEIGKRDIYANSRLGLRPFRKNLALFAVDLDAVMRQRPAPLGRMLRELVREVSDGRLAPLPCRVFAAADAAGAFRHVQGGRHTGKVVLSMQKRPAAVAPGDEPLSLRADGSYLVTGGLGGFGLAVARRLAERGARHLVLAGRGGAETEEARQAVADLEKLGAQVTVVRADVSRAEDVARLLAEVDRTLPPLRGVFHAAMVLEDALLLNLGEDLLRRVLAPKVSGAWELHTQTLGRPLDYFVLFSSLSSVFGHAGQGNYAAANAFLDALAWHRRALGLPALTINWGYLGGVGYLAQRQQLGERLERQGVSSFTPAQALALLERLLQGPAVQASVMRVDWSRWRGLGVTGKVSPRFAHLIQGAQSAGEGRQGLPTLDAILAAGPAERRGLVDALLRDKVARVLGSSPDRLDGEKPLLNLGLDSLMAVELRNWIESELRVNLPIVELMRSPSLARLTEMLLELLARVDGTPGAAVDLGVAGVPAEHKNGTAPAQSPWGEADEDPSVFPLAHGQRGLWFLYQMDRTSPAYNLCFPSRIRSRLDLAAFRRVLQALIDRHSCLRTTFEERDGELLQRIHEDVPVHLEIVDASSWSEEVLHARFEEEVYRPFDLERGPLMRTFLFTRWPEDHVFLLTAHHLVGDFWSLVVIMEDFRILYRAEHEGGLSVLPPLTGHYRDFVRWQETLLAGPEGDRLWSYWSEQLAGASSVLELPTDRPRPPRQTHRGGSVPCRLDADLTRRMKALAAEEGVTLYTVILAAFQALLGRYSGQEDLIVGSPFACRSRPEFERLVGYFINMLPMRADLSGDPSFRVLLRRAGATAVEALQHQDYPFSLLVERLGLKRDPSRTPLVQASFTLEKADRQAEVGAWRFYLAQVEGQLDVGGLQMEPYRVEQRTCHSELELVLEDGDGTIAGILCCNTDLFDLDTAGRMVGQLRTLLEAATAGPDRRLSELPWLTESERRQVVNQWNETQADYPSGLCLHRLFERQAACTPQAVALRGGGRVVRYGELDAWADRLARRLRSRGVGPGVPVALCLERSPEMVAAVLAVLKAGGAFVPLDPASPPERLRDILADTRAPVVLTHGAAAESMPAVGVEVICLDGSAADTRQGTEAEETPGSAAGPGDLAYVICTSGSTGRPKGVMVEHRAICNTVLWRQQALPFRADDRVLLTIPPFFDPSVCIIFSTLAAGAELVLPGPGEERDPPQLLERVRREGVTVLPAPPRLLRLLLDSPGAAEACRTVRWVCCGGEAMPPDLPGRLFDTLDVDLFNLYGPTEAAVETSMWPCARGDKRMSVPIGRPIANVRVYVLDAHGRPVPAGVPGELYVGGAGLACGYLGDPRQTAERFVPDPFGGTPGARLYRTGDRCRWLADGALEFLGRLDRQVKVRGYRVEAGEVEAALAAHPAVHEAAVALHGHNGESRLVAYVAAPPGGEAPGVADLRTYLRGRLPEYMVPSAFVTLPQLPHTPTGKIDRRALPAPANGRSGSDRPFVPARTALEEFLVGLWRDLSGVESVGVEDNFFDLGGNSIQAAMLVNRLQQQLGEQVYTVALFELPTVAGLARYLGEAHPEVVGRLFGAESLPQAGGAGNGAAARRFGGVGVRDPRPADLVVPLQPEGSGPACFMVHPPGGVVVCYQALARHLGREQPFYGIRARGLYGEPNLPSRLEDMAAEYVTAIREVQPEGPYHLGGWSLGGVVALEMAQQLLAQGQSVGLLAFLDTTIPFGRANQDFTEGEDRSGREYGLDVTLEELGQLGPDEQLPYLFEHVQKLGLMDTSAPLEVVQQFLNDLKRLFHTHLQLASEYALRPYPGRITLFRPLEMPVDVGPTPADRGWGRLADAVDVLYAPGQHHTMVNEPHVQTLAEQLRACLRRAEVRQHGAARHTQPVG